MKAQAKGALRPADSQEQEGSVKVFFPVLLLFLFDKMLGMQHG